MIAHVPHILGMQTIVFGCVGGPRMFQRASFRSNDRKLEVPVANQTALGVSMNWGSFTRDLGLL